MMDKNVRLVLKNKFEEGLNSTTKKAEDQALSEQLKVYVKQIKVWYSIVTSDTGSATYMHVYEVSVD